MSHDPTPAARDVLNAADAIHAALGPGLFDTAYARCLAIEMEHRRRAFRREGTLLVVDDRVVVQVLAVDEVLPSHFARLDAALRERGGGAGLLLNFNVARMRDGVVQLVAGPA